MRQIDSYYMIQSLRIVKFFYDIGQFDEALKFVTWIHDEDYGELFLNGIGSLAPMFEVEELGEEVCCGGHTLYHFSDPAMTEYYRLSRLYEYKHSIAHENNPYFIKADEHFIECCRYTNGNFGACYDNDDHPREIQIETCPERPLDELELLICIHDVMEFYRNEVIELHKELMRGPMVWLPALPAPKPEKKKRKRRKQK